MEHYKNLEEVMMTETFSKNGTSSRIQMNRETYAIKLKALFIIIGLCICFSCFSQLSQTNKNEINLDFLMTVMKYPTISYERFLGRHVGIGLSLGFPLKGSETEDVRLLPYGRFYFGEIVTSEEIWTGRYRENSYNDEHFQVTVNEHHGFFIEINTGIFGSEELNESTWRYHNATKFGLGAAVGWKILGRDAFNKLGQMYSIGLENLTCEMFLGLGWGIDDFKLAYPRFGVSIGIPF
jgi:hypothetical protein